MLLRLISSRIDLKRVAILSEEANGVDQTNPITKILGVFSR
jgi:hypothetical protein